MTPRPSPPRAGPAVPDLHSELAFASEVMGAPSCAQGTCDSHKEPTSLRTMAALWRGLSQEVTSLPSQWTEHSLGNPGNQVPSLWHEWPSRSVVQSFEETMDLRCFPRSRGPDLGQPRTQPRYRQWISPRQDSSTQLSLRVLKVTSDSLPGWPLLESC